MNLSKKHFFRGFIEGFVFTEFLIILYILCIIL